MSRLRRLILALALCLAAAPLAPTAYAQSSGRPHMEPRTQVKVMRTQTRIRVLNLKAEKSRSGRPADVIGKDCADINVAPVQSGRTPKSAPIVVTGDIIQLCGR